MNEVKNKEMTAKEKVKEDLKNVKMAVGILKEDLKDLRDEERTELKNEIKEALGEYADEIEAIKDFDSTLIEKLGKHGRTFVYICIGILLAAAVDQAWIWVKGLF